MQFPDFRYTLYFRLLRCCGSIRGVAVCNSHAMGEAHENSDIDLFIMAPSGKIWTARFLATLFASVLGIRRRNTHGLEKWTPAYIRRTKNKLCLSFFITEDAMNFETIRLQPHDPYLDRWIETLVPIIDKKAIFAQFQSQTTRNVTPQKWWFLERIIRHFWLPKTLKTYEKLGKPWWVVISDIMLKFHDQDKRKEYRDAHKIRV